MFNNLTNTPIRQFKTKVNLTINPEVYQSLKKQLKRDYNLNLG